MDNLLTNPAIQSGILPFVVAFVALAVFRRLGALGVALSFALAYLCSVYFTMGLQIIPLNSTRKLLLIAIAALVLGLLWEKSALRKSWLLSISSGLFGSAILWVIWPILNNQSGLNLALVPIATIIYVSWLNSLTQSIPKTNGLPAIILCTLGFGTGISAMLGASALLGQLAITVGASLGALIIWQFIQRNLTTGSGLILSATWLVGSIGIAAVAYAQLPWYSLIPLALLPLSFFIPPIARLASGQNRLIAMAISLTIGFIFAGIAALITWQSAGDPMY